MTSEAAQFTFTVKPAVLIQLQTVLTLKSVNIVAFCEKAHKCKEAKCRKLATTLVVNQLDGNKVQAALRNLEIKFCRAQVIQIVLAPIPGQLVKLQTFLYEQKIKFQSLYSGETSVILVPVKKRFAATYEALEDFNPNEDTTSE